jgi:PhnB protein
MAQTLGAYLTIDGAAAAIEFYKTAFGATEVRRMPADHAPGKLIHAEIELFGGLLSMSDAFDDFDGGTKSPQALGGTTFNMIVGLDAPADVDAIMAKAEAAGATITMPAENTFWGARFGMVRDPFGHMWGFNADISPPG